MGDYREGSRRQRRRHVRRLARLRRRRERRRAAVALGLVALAGLALLTPLGVSDDRRADAPAAEAPAGAPGGAATALERSRDHAQRWDGAIDSVLAYTDFLRAGRPAKREVALTFDDGPSAYTKRILEILRRHDAPATFFLSGYMLDEHPKLSRRILSEGHALGNHGADHIRMAGQPSDVQAQQLDSVAAALGDRGLEAPRLFRPPYGAFDADTLALLERRRALMVLWSIDTGDYENPGAEAIVARALSGVGPGDVILLHDGGGDRAQTVAALPEILAGLRKRDLRPVTVPELLIDNPPPRSQGLGAAAAVAPPGAGLGG